MAPLRCSARLPAALRSASLRSPPSVRLPRVVRGTVGLSPRYSPASFVGWLISRLVPLWLVLPRRLSIIPTSSPRPPHSASRRSRPPPKGAPLLVGVCYIIIKYLKNFRSENVNLSEKFHNFGKIAKQLRHTSASCPFENHFVSLWTLFYVQPINLLKNYGKR